jgi:hypothetical protein
VKTLPIKKNYFLNFGLENKSPFCSGSSGLHGVLAGAVDPDVTLLDVLLWNTLL